MEKHLTWKSYLYYIIATAIVAVLVANCGHLLPAHWALGLGVALVTTHLYICARLSMEISYYSYPWRDRLLIGCLFFSLNALVCFAALYYQQGVCFECRTQNSHSNSFLLCLLVSLENFIQHPVSGWQAAGHGARIAAVVEAVAGGVTLLILGYFVVQLFQNRSRES